MWVLEVMQNPLELIRIVMEMIDDSIQMYEKFPEYAPAKWVLENWWKTLDIAVNHVLPIPYFDAQDDEQ